MNLAGVEAFARQHRTALLAGGAVGVGGIALYKRRGGTSSGGKVDSGPTPTAASTVGQPADPYASTAYDVYDALQPQLEQATGQLQTEIDAANARLDGLNSAGGGTLLPGGGNLPNLGFHATRPGSRVPARPTHKTAKPSPKKPVKTSRLKTGKVSQPKPAKQQAKSKLVNPLKPAPARRPVVPPRTATPMQPRRR